MVVGLTVALAGCDSDMRSQLESDAKRLEAKCDSLKRENETLRLAVDNLRAEKAVMEKDLARLKSDNNSLKTQLESEKESAAAQIEQLKAQLAAARQATPPPGAAAATPGSAKPAAPGTPPAPVRDEQAIIEAERSVAELQSAITPIQARVNQGKDKILSIIRAAVDVPMVPPAGGVIRNGQIYSLRCTEPSVRWIVRGSHKDAFGNTVHERYPVYHTHDDSCYQPIGPAVKVGDFRTVLERNKAIQAAKDANLPLEQELKTLSDELTKTKEKLAKLRAASAPN
jgi:outer membrane murein-binding lipoprotein Lpp